MDNYTHDERGARRGGCTGNNAVKPGLAYQLGCHPFFSCTPSPFLTRHLLSRDPRTDRQNLVVKLLVQVLQAVAPGGCAALELRRMRQPSSGKMSILQNNTILLLSRIFRICLLTLRVAGACESPADCGPITNLSQIPPLHRRLRRTPSFFILGSLDYNINHSGIRVVWWNLIANKLYYKFITKTNIFKYF